jgi:hypothetical protein
MHSRFVFKGTAKMKADGAGMKSALNHEDALYDTGMICLPNFIKVINILFIITELL